MPYKDPENRKAAWRKYYHSTLKSDPERLSKLRTATSNARIRNKVITQKARDVPCADCGVRYPYYVMDFDHINDDKESSVSELAGTGISVNRLKIEMAKCEVVCSNCHRIRTHDRRESVSKGCKSRQTPVVTMSVSGDR